MFTRRIACILAILFCLNGFASKSMAQGTEERFQDVFITAGYATAFGAALGAAFLSFVPNPASELRYVAIGASLGFIGGSILGSYMVFAPAFAMEEPKSDARYALTDKNAPDSELSKASYMPVQKTGLTLQPTWNVQKHTLASVSGQLTLLTF